jgi:hypothetical protein
MVNDLENDGTQIFPIRISEGVLRTFGYDEL